MNIRINLGFILAFSFASMACRADNWPCFRGPNGQGVSTETNLPLTWSTNENVRWKTPIPGQAWSSPIVWGDKVFVTTATDQGRDCHVIALDRDSGKVLWDKVVLTQAPGHRNPRNSYATPTPCSDGERVYAVFGDGSFVALNMTGERVWTNRSFPFYSEHGLGTSPILWGDLLIMARDGSHEPPDTGPGWHSAWDQAFVLALDTRTGEVRWKTKRGLSRIAHVVPAIWTAPDGRAQVISGAGDVVQGFDAKTGELIWTSKNIGEGVVPSIVLGDGMAFTTSGYGGRESIRAFRLDGKGDLGDTNLVWEQRKNMSRIPSMLCLKPRLYSVTENGTAMALRGSTGDILWQEKLGSAFSASPVAAEGRLYFLSDSGETIVIEAGDQFKVLAHNPLGEKTQASMAVSQGKFFIRTVNSLYCIGAAPMAK
jgi:outer membrane protein assembly factor BamB